MRKRAVCLLCLLMLLSAGCAGGDKSGAAGKVPADHTALTPITVAPKTPAKEKLLTLSPEEMTSRNAFDVAVYLAGRYSHYQHTGLYCFTREAVFVSPEEQQAAISVMPGGKDSVWQATCCASHAQAQAHAADYAAESMREQLGLAACGEYGDRLYLPGQEGKSGYYQDFTLTHFDGTRITAAAQSYDGAGQPAGMVEFTISYIDGRYRLADCQPYDGSEDGYMDLRPPA